ncbi:MAG: hypothetical protein LUD47_05435 [Clostridia bacterium]|nr:hypothetical protein [Clostridia bacterium]
MGTCKTVALVSCNARALQCGKALVAGVQGGGLHGKLTRAVVLLLGNIANGKGRLIFNMHDEALLDCKKIFRQDRILDGRDREDGGEYFYSLFDDGCTCRMSLEGADLCDMCRRGDMGACSEPDSLSVVLPKKEGDGEN